jgi:hypothetical protein
MAAYLLLIAGWSEVGDVFGERHKADAFLVRTGQESPLVPRNPVDKQNVLS